MSFGSKRLEKFPEYIFSRLAQAKAEVEKASGRKVLDLGAGSPDIIPSPTYIAKFKELLDDPRAHLYPGYRGIPEFNEAVCAWYKQRFNVDLSPDEVLPLLGGKDGIAHLPLALSDTGDEILVPNPGYPPFSEPALMYDIKPVYYDLLPENNFKPIRATLEKLVTPRTKYLWINYPSNPTGAVASLEELTTYAAFAKGKNIALVYDNAYSEIAFDNFVAPSILQVVGAKEFAVEIGSFSKTFSFAGFRMGWIVGNRDIVAAIQKVKSQLDSGMSLPLQRLGAYALMNQDKEWHASMIRSYQERRDVIAKKLQTLGLTFSMPKGSLYIWAKIHDSARDSESFCMNLLKERQVLFTPGSAYGTNGARYIRASICVNVDSINDYL
jgi:aspartate/methionine/tyrosine aminotransferase